MSPAINHWNVLQKLKNKLQVIYDLPFIDEKASEDMFRLEQVIRTYERLYSDKGPR